MVRVALAVNQVGRSESPAMPSGVAGTSSGSVMVNNGRTWLDIVNGNASTRVLTIEIPVTVDGQVVTNLAVTIPGSGTAGGRAVIGPFPPGDYNQLGSSADYGSLYIDYPASHESDLTMIAFSL